MGTTVAGHDSLRIRAGVSYRQLDHWIRSGYVPGVDSAGGRGHAREFTAQGERRVILLGQLTRAGFTLAKALQIAQRFERGDVAFDLGNELTLRRA